MPEFLRLTLFALLLSCGVMTLAWWRQLYTRNAGIVDGWWAYLFGLIAILYMLAGEGEFTRHIFIVLAVSVWSFRLGTHLLIRNTTHNEEDSRYRKLREEYGTRENFLMWRFFMYQAFSNVLLSIPFLIISLDTSDEPSNFLWAGLAIWLVAFLGESAADWQLKIFKKNPVNKGKVYEQGLWKYSRHPNYFFEWLIWVGYFTMALGSPFGWIAIICPALMYLMLNKVTGIPMLEELAVKTKGNDYVRYQATTSAFFPWFRKKTE